MGDMGPKKLLSLEEFERVYDDTGELELLGGELIGPLGSAALPFPAGGIMDDMGTTTLMSFAEFELLDAGADEVELLRGELIRMPPPQRRHMQICRRLLKLLDAALERWKRGHPRSTYRRSGDRNGVPGFQRSAMLLSAGREPDPSRSAWRALLRGRAPAGLGGGIRVRYRDPAGQESRRLSGPRRRRGVGDLPGTATRLGISWRGAHDHTGDRGDPQRAAAGGRDPARRNIAGVRVAEERCARKRALAS